MPEAGSKRGRGIIELDKALEKNGNNDDAEGSIATVFPESMFHNDTPAEEDYISNEI